MRRFQTKRVRATIFALATLLLTEPVQAQTLFPIDQCNYPHFSSCASFQNYWDRVGREGQAHIHFNCPFPTHARSCWRPRSYQIPFCRDSAKPIDFIKAHDAFSGIFRRALSSGDLKPIPRVAKALELLNAVTMDLLWAYQNRDQVEQTAKDLRNEDALELALILYIHTTDIEATVHAFEEIYINIRDCTQFPPLLASALNAVFKELNKLAAKDLQRIANERICAGFQPRTWHTEEIGYWTECDPKTGVISERSKVLDRPIPLCKGCPIR